MSYYNHFAEQSTTRIGDWIKQRARQRQLALVQPFFRSRDCAILEIGPGLGELTDLCLQAGYRDYAVVEPNRVMRERLAARGITTKNYSLPYLQEQDEAYDVILLFHVFEHLNGTREAQIFLSEAHRVLRTGGLLCILSPDYLHWQKEFFNGDYTHSNITTVRRTLQLFHDYSFAVLTYAHFSGFFSGPLATMASYLIRLALCFSSGNGLDKKVYKLKTTFLRTFLIAATKTNRL